MNFVDVNDKKVRDTVERIKALRRLSTETGVKTYKSQSAILESLDPQTLAAVALVLNPANEKENANVQSTGK